MLRNILLASCFLLSACATVVHPSKQEVRIDSTPSGAQLMIDGKTLTTPANLSLRGKDEYMFTLSKPGYTTVQGKVDSEFRIWTTVLGNILNLTGVIGMAVDVFGTGTAYELQKDNNITLIADGSAEFQPAQSSPITTPYTTPAAEPSVAQPVVITPTPSAPDSNFNIQPSQQFVAPPAPR